ncbi:hypothetical protein EBS40_04200 [bacterium]|nr:hypothetical protein [bacterium]NDG18629.1 hypothetical protein [Betaproteobacteria bacterium]
MRSGLFLTLPAVDVCVFYEALEPRSLLGLPEQIDITHVWLDLDHGPEASRKKRVNILHALDEGTIINLEDEILEHRKTNPRKPARKSAVLQELPGSVTAGDGGSTQPVPIESLRILVD